MNSMRPCLTRQVLYAVSRLLLIASCGMLIAAPAICATPNLQYTNIAPLPGGGIAINQRGNIDGQGAMQVNIPVAYTPGWGYLSLGGFRGRHPVETSPDEHNGSGFVGVGLFENHRLFLSLMQVSRLWEECKAVSGQVSLVDETIATPAISVGVQDIARKEPDGLSPYVVATKSFSLASQQAFVTYGFGTGRFLDRPFAGLSLSLTDNLNLAAEWDGFQVNGGLGWRPQGRKGNLTVLGAYNGRAGWLIGASVAFDLKP